MIVEGFVAATLEVAKLRWPASRPSPGLPIQRAIGTYHGADILWPIKGATVDRLHLVEVNGVPFHISRFASHVDGFSLSCAASACLDLAQNLDFQSSRMREMERPSLELLEREAAAVLVAHTDAEQVPQCLIPLLPVAARIRILHELEVPASRIVGLVTAIMGHEIYPSRVRIESAITGAEVTVNVWQNFNFGWAVLHTSMLYTDRVRVYMTAFLPEGREFSLDAGLPTVVRHLAELTPSPDEAVSFMDRLNYLIAHFGQEEGK
jgi:hypothetical protein